MNHTCPFCGSAKLAITEERAGIVERVMYWVRCRICGAQGPWKTDRAQAIGLWDTRCEPQRTATIADVDEVY